MSKAVERARVTGGTVVHGACRKLYPGIVRWSRAEREKIQAARRRQVRRWLAAQAPRERRIADGRIFGAESLQSLADRYGISKERVRQIEGRLARSLHEFEWKQAGNAVARAPRRKG